MHVELLEWESSVSAGSACSEKSPTKQDDQYWWFQPTCLKICSSNGIISPNFGVKIKEHLHLNHYLQGNRTSQGGCWISTTGDKWWKKKNVWNHLSPFVIITAEQACCQEFETTNYLGRLHHLWTSQSPNPLRFKIDPKHLPKSAVIKTRTWHSMKYWLVNRDPYIGSA